jgi:hypothetical protein
MSGRIRASHVSKGTVPHLTQYENVSCLSDYKIIIPSFDRPEVLCETTLSLLRRHQVEMENVAVFVDPGVAPGQTAPEWYRYLEAFRKHDFLSVQLHPGAKGLTANMDAALRWVRKGYFITMSDRVSEILLPARSRGGRVRAVPAPPGTLKALISHGYDMLLAGPFAAWSLNSVHNPYMLRPDVLSRRLGLLDGNLSGCILPGGWETFAVNPEHGLIYDVEWSVRLWATGFRFIRYMGLCVKHAYRAKGGQSTLHPDADSRRLAEHRAIKALSHEFPSLISFVNKTNASHKHMLYVFQSGQESTISMRSPANRPGRPLENGSGRPATDVERQRKHRLKSSKCSSRRSRARGRGSRKRPASKRRT